MIFFSFCNASGLLPLMLKEIKLMVNYIFDTETYCIGKNF